MFERRRRHSRMTHPASATVALACALFFGALLLLGGDWVPGAIIVVAAVVGLTVQLHVIRRGGAADHTRSGTT